MPAHVYSPPHDLKSRGEIVAKDPNAKYIHREVIVRTPGPRAASIGPHSVIAKEPPP